MSLHKLFLLHVQYSKTLFDLSLPNTGVQCNNEPH